MGRRPRRSPRRRPPAADLLRAWLAERQRTQAWLADVLGVHVSAVWAWTGGRSHPSLELAAVLEGFSGGAVPATSWVDPGEIRRIIDSARKKHEKKC